jgi:hypothetical protein
MFYSIWQAAIEHSMSNARFICILKLCTSDAITSRHSPTELLTEQAAAAATVAVPASQKQQQHKQQQHSPFSA